jgi:hypothetical protein
VCFIRYVFFVTVTVICRVVVFPPSHYRVFLPRLDLPTMRQCPSTRVCFLWVIASFPFLRIEGPTTQLASFSCIYVAPFTPLPSSHSIRQWLCGVGMNTISVLSCGINDQKFSKPISHWKARVTSNRCVMLEATHRSTRCCGLGVHTVSSAWCKRTRDETTWVVASGTAHMHG